MLNFIYKKQSATFNNNLCKLLRQTKTNNLASKSFYSYSRKNFSNLPSVRTAYK